MLKSIFRDGLSRADYDPRELPENARTNLVTKVIGIISISRRLSLTPIPVMAHYARYALVIKTGGIMRLSHLWNDESGQDIAEYAVMLAVILVLVVGTVRLIGSNSNTVFSNVASSMQ